MNPLDISEAEFTALLEEVDSKYHAWHLKKLRPERVRRMKDLGEENLTSGGWACRALQICRECLEREVRKWIRFYAEVARKRHKLGMFSKPRLNQFRERVVTFLRAACTTLKDENERYSRATADGTRLPDDHRYVVLKGEILNVVTAELRVLEAEGILAPEAGPQQGTGAAAPSEPAETRKNGNASVVANEKLPDPESKPLGQAKVCKASLKRGPKKDYETALRVADIAERCKGDGGWRSKLEDICDALDEGKVPCPKPWKKRGHRTWCDCWDSRRDLVVKAIDHHLELARQHEQGPL